MQIKVVSARALTRLMHAGIDAQEALRLHTDPPLALRANAAYTHVGPAGEECIVERGLCIDPHPVGHYTTMFNTDEGRSLVIVSEWYGQWIIVCDDEYPCWLEEDDDVPAWLEDA